jgi:hypothetical protein
MLRFQPFFWWRKKRKIKILPLDTGEARVAILFGHQQTTAPGSLHKFAKKGLEII